MTENIPTISFILRFQKSHAYKKSILAEGYTSVLGFIRSCQMKNKNQVNQASLNGITKTVVSMFILT